MIVSFFSKEAEKIFHGDFSKKIPESIQQTCYDKLHILDASMSLDDLRIPPSNHLEKLKGRMQKYYSIRINQQYRICFEWKNGNAYNIDITDYH